MIKSLRKYQSIQGVCWVALINTTDIHIGCAATNEIQKKLQKDTVIIEQVHTFKRKARYFVIATLKKTYAKFPLLFLRC